MQASISRRSHLPNCSSLSRGCGECAQWAPSHQHIVTRAFPRLSAEPSTSGRGLVTYEEVEQVAKRRGLHVGLKTLGPFYRITCRQDNEDGRILGVTSGFVVPLLGLMHCDTLQIFTRGLNGEKGQQIRGGPLGLGLLLGGATFSYGHSCGCRKAEILAINDDDAWHERLVHYYGYFGFKPVKRVEGGSLEDLPHMLVWGGVGTRMDADIEQMLKRWTPALRRTLQQEQSEEQAAAIPTVPL